MSSNVAVSATPNLAPVAVRHRSLDLSRWQQWSISLSAGIGGVFSFVLANDLISVFHTPRLDTALEEFVVVLLLSVAVLVFLDPIVGSLRSRLGVEGDHSAETEENSSLRLRFEAFAILILANLFHELLHKGVQEFVHAGTTRDARALVGSLASMLLPATITFFWISAARRRPSRAAWIGGFSGLIAVSLVIGAVAVLFPASLRVPHQLYRIVILSLRWPLVGLIGGWSIDRHWGRKVHRLALIIFIFVVVYGTGMWGIKYLQDLNNPKGPTGLLFIRYVATMLGWSLALIGCASSGALTSPGQHETGIHRIN